MDFPPHFKTSTGQRPNTEALLRIIQPCSAPLMAGPPPITPE